MARSSKEVNNILQKQFVKMLSKAIVNLNKEEEAVDFFNDFLTSSELTILSKRVGIAYWLKKRRSYSNIKNNLKTSSATISSVSEMMKKKGFGKMLENIEAEEWANLWSSKIKKFVRK